MSGTGDYVPYVGRGGGTDTIQAADTTLRSKAVLAANPWLGSDPDAVMTFANSDLTPTQLVTQASEIYARQQGTEWVERLANMSEGTQRSIWGTLTPGQQAALGDMGYAAPSRDDGDGFWEQRLDNLGTAAGAVLGVAGTVLSPVATPVLKSLTWLGDQSARAYRTIRTMDDNAQLVALGGAVAGGALIAASPLTGGASAGPGAALLTGGAIGLGAVGGASLAGFAYNPNDFRRAFAAAANGERIFDRPSQARVNDLLGHDPKVQGLALDLATVTGLKVDEFVRDVAAIPGPTNQNAQLSLLQELASDFGEPGTPEHQQAMGVMVDLLKDPTFAEAVKTLQHGKISIGRDLADQFFAPDSKWHTLVSGATDALWVVTVDPTLMLGGAAKWNKARQVGLRLGEDGQGAARFLDISNNNTGVRRYHELIAQAVDLGSKGDRSGAELIRRYAPEVKELYQDMVAHRRLLVEQSALHEGEEFTVDHFRQWMVGNEKLIPILQGRGTVRGSQGILLKGLNSRNLAYKYVATHMRSFTNGLTDAATERHMLQRIDEAVSHGMCATTPSISSSPTPCGASSTRTPVRSAICGAPSRTTSSSSWHSRSSTT